MPFRFRKTVRIGPVRLNVGKRGFTSLGVGRTTLRSGYTPRTSIPTGIAGLSFQVGGKRTGTKAPKPPASPSGESSPTPRPGGRLRRWFFYALGGLTVLCVFGALLDNGPDAETTSVATETLGPTETALPAVTAQVVDSTPAADAAALLPAAKPTAQPAAVEPTAPAPTTPILETAAPTAETAGAPRGVVARTANMRDQPTAVGSTVIESLAAGESVTLRRRVPDGTWLAVETQTGVVGWVSAGLLTVTPEVFAALPVGTTDEAISVGPTAVVAQQPTAVQASGASSVVIVEVNKRAETVTLQNTGTQPVDLSRWRLLSVTGGQDHPIGGVLEPGATREFPGPEGNIWNNSESDPAHLIAPSGQVVDTYP